MSAINPRGDKIGESEFPSPPHDNNTDNNTTITTLNSQERTCCTHQGEWDDGEFPSYCLGPVQATPVDSGHVDGQTGEREGKTAVEVGRGRDTEQMVGVVEGRDWMEEELEGGEDHGLQRNKCVQRITSKRRTSYVCYL